MNYDEMEPGRELDALVAEAMGCNVVKEEYNGWPAVFCECEYEHGNRPHASKTSYVSGMLAYYSTGPAPALEALDQFTDVIIEKSGENWTVQIAQGGFEPVTRQTLPYAISIAVCKAKDSLKNEVKQ